MSARLVLLAEQVAARLGLALVLAFAVTVLPTVAHSLWTGGPLEAVAALVALVRWILTDLRPDAWSL